MIDQIQNDCCGCAACVVNCPYNCIIMKKNTEGFLYPYVDKKRCIGCNLCETKCPIVNKIESKSIGLGKLIRIKDEDVLMKSASGGFFSALVKSMLEERGVFCGATFDENWNVIHKISNQLDDLVLMRGSKYVQSNIEHCLIPIKEYLKKGIRVIFCGTPCQVQALKKYLGPLGSSNLLITIDVVCKGVGSPQLWENYLNYQKKKYRSDITNLCFRKKVHGYHSSNMVIQFQNGKKSSRSKTDLYMRSYINEYCSRKSCYNCAFKGIDRCSDFTVFDAWHASNLIDKSDDDKGYTTVIVHNEQARILLEKLTDRAEIYTIDLKKAIKLDGSMIWKQPESKSNRSAFLTIGCSQGIDVSTKIYFPVSYKDKLAEILKSILYAVGLLQFIKKILYR